MSPFECVYGFQPLTPLDLLPLPLKFVVSADGKKKAEKVKELHRSVHDRIELSNAKAAAKANKGKKKLELKEDDWVWIRLRKERFPNLRRSKLDARADGPFRIVKKINDNAFQLDLEGKYQVSPVFNVTDLIPFVSTDSRSNPFQVGGDDAIHEEPIHEGPIEESDEKLEQQGGVLDMEGSDYDGQHEEMDIYKGPMTRSKAKELQQLVQGLLSQVQPTIEEPKVLNIIQAQNNEKPTQESPHFSPNYSLG